MKKIYIHIGVHKTGSTSIQRGLHQNKKYIHASGYGYLILNNHANYIKKIRSDPVELERHKNKICNQINKSKFQNIILSDERYSGMPRKGYYPRNIVASLLHEILRNFHITIVVYIRRQDLFIESLNKQWIHAGESLSFSEFCDSAQLDRLHLYKNDVVYDFFNTIGINNVNQLKLPGVINKSYSNSAIELALKCNKVLSNEEKIILRGMLQSAEFTTINSEIGIFSGEQRCDFLKIYEDSNRVIYENYKIGKVGESLFSTPSSEPNHKQYEVDQELLSQLIAIMLVQQEQKMPRYMFKALVSIENNVIKYIKKLMNTLHMKKYY